MVCNGKVHHIPSCSYARFYVWIVRIVTKYSLFVYLILPKIPLYLQELICIL